MKALLIKLAIVGNWQRMFSRRVSDVFVLKISIQMLSQQFFNYVFFSLLHKVYYSKSLEIAHHY